jgi:hypothetical protein
MWHSILGWLKSGDWTPSFDGTAAIVAGVIGFIAIIRQTRSSERNVRKQLEAEKSARAEERKAQIRAIATSLLAEIRGFRNFHIEPILGRDRATLTVKILDAAFTIYPANAHRIGDLGAGTCEAVVSFYDFALEHLAKMRRYSEILHEPPLKRDYDGTEKLGTSERDAQAEDNKDRRASEFLNREIGSRMPDLKAAAEKAERSLEEALRASQ